MSKLSIVVALVLLCCLAISAQASFSSSQALLSHFRNRIAQEFADSSAMETDDDESAEESLVQIFKSEGKCQNWASDAGNKYQGKIGYTCMGVIPQECWEQRNSLFGGELLSGFKGHPADFCYYAYNKDTEAYKAAAAQLYKTKYFDQGKCSGIPMPAYYICADIAVNSGVGRSRQYLNELGGYNGQDAKKFARQLNERHRKDYLYWGRPGTDNNKFLKGWLARADMRAKFIDNYDN